MDNLRLLGSIALAASWIGSVQAGEWTVDETMSSVGFVAEQQGSKFNGRFEDFSAMIDFDPDAPGAGHIVGVVTTDSVNTRDHDRDASLTDRDWFDSANYAEARFESSSIEAVDDGTYVARGELTLKGTTKDASLTFAFDSSGSSADFDGKMTINRFDYNVGEGWNDTSWVGEKVEVQVKLSLSQ